MNPRHIFGEAFSIETLIAAVVFAGVCLAVVVAMAMSRRKRRTDAAPSQRDENPKLELVYAVLVAAVAAFVVYLSFSTTHQERTKTAPNATHVTVTAFQWCWRFTYPQNGRTVTGTCVPGNRPTMVVPVGTPITMQITSRDVIHSWWVPELRYKLDAFPNHTNQITFTVEHAGEWPGRCAEFCGTGHYAMDFTLRAVSPEHYQQWLAGT